MALNLESRKCFAPDEKCFFETLNNQPVENPGVCTGVCRDLVPFDCPFWQIELDGIGLVEIPDSGLKWRKGAQILCKEIDPRIYQYLVYYRLDSLFTI